MIVTFGEIMMRLAPPGYQRFKQASSFMLTFGGGEANVAVSAAGFGLPARFVTRLPDNDFGTACCNELKKWGVDTSCISFGNGRMGIYFCEKGASQRPSKVIYDRADSAIALSAPEDFNWDDILKGAKWFHFTGITPALSDSVAETTLNACRMAKEKGITVSCDLNYRKNLWSREKAGQVMSGLMEYVDLLIANEEDAADVFGIHAPNSDVTGAQISYDGYSKVAQTISSRFGISKVAITLRQSISASQNNWSALLYNGKETLVSPRYNIQIIDRIGGGDSFGGGLIYGLLSGKSDQQAVDFAVAASCLKHTIEGDFNCVSVREVEALAGGDGSGRVQR